MQIRKIMPIQNSQIHYKNTLKDYINSYLLHILCINDDSACLYQDTMVSFMGSPLTGGVLYEFAFSKNYRR